MLQGIISQQLVPRLDGTGLVVASELMVVTPAVRNLIREGKHYQINNMIQNGMSQGMVSLERELATLCNQEVISEDEARIRAQDMQLFDTYLTALK